MAYEMPLVCKEVYLPVDGLFIRYHEGETFGDFSISYKKEYGIDLHEIFKLINKDGDFHMELRYPCKLYSVILNESPLNNIVSPAILKSIVQPQADNESALLSIGFEDNRGTEAGISLIFCLPAQGTVVKSIDDLIIDTGEI